MRVLIISAAFPPMCAGEATNTFHLCQRLAERGLDIHVLTTRGHVSIPGFPFKIYPVMRDWSWGDLPRLVKCLKVCSPQAILLIYIGFIYNDHPMITFAPTLCHAVLPSVPFVTRFENAEGSNPYSLPTRFFRKGVKLWAGSKNVDYAYGTLLRDSERIIVLSERHRDRLSEHYAPVVGKSVLIPPPSNMQMCQESNGVARRLGREILGVEPDEFLIGYLGYIYPAKGIETILRAFQIVNKQTPKARLVFIGGTLARVYSQQPFYAQEMKELSQRLGIDERVIWTGAFAWDAEETSRYLYAADICVLPFNIGVQLNNSSFSAAAAHGLPIITTQGKMLEQPFIHEENVFLCPPKNPEAMATAIETLRHSPELRQQLRTGVLRLTKEWFSWESAIERTLATFS